MHPYVRNPGKTTSPSTYPVRSVYRAIFAQKGEPVQARSHWSQRFSRDCRPRPKGRNEARTIARHVRMRRPFRSLDLPVRYRQHPMRLPTSPHPRIPRIGIRQRPRRGRWLPSKIKQYRDASFPVAHTPFRLHPVPPPICVPFNLHPLHSRVRILPHHLFRASRRSPRIDPLHRPSVPRSIKRITNRPCPRINKGHRVSRAPKARVRRLLRQTNLLDRLGLLHLCANRLDVQRRNPA